MEVKQIINIKTSHSIKFPEYPLKQITSRPKTNAETAAPRLHLNTETSQVTDENIYQYDSDDSYERMKEEAFRTTRNLGASLLEMTDKSAYDDT